MPGSYQEMESDYIDSRESKIGTLARPMAAFVAEDIHPQIEQPAKQSFRGQSATVAVVQQVPRKERAVGLGWRFVFA